MEIHKLRRLMFWPLLTLTSIILIATEYTDYPDTCLQIYGGISVISISCFVIFWTWWFKKGSASEIYKWLTFLMAGIGYSNILQWYARYNYAYIGMEEYEAFINTFIWQYRNFPMLIAMIFMLSFIFGQIYGDKKDDS